MRGAIRKPDLLLCEEGVITKRVVRQAKFDMRTDVYSLGEVKKTFNEENTKDSYVELAGKVALLLEAQDGRCMVPGIRLVGSHIFLTIFDRGGSISTFPLNIHKFPEQFLRILLGLTFANGTGLGFDSTISPIQKGQKSIQIAKQNKTYNILVDTLLFSSGSLHSRGTTVWSGKVTIDEKEQEVVVKDSWIDPLRRYTEGRVLKMLKKAGVHGVPTLTHEQQVRTLHPVTREIVNHSTHIFRTLLSGSSEPSYYLRVLSRLVSRPRGYPIFDFNSLAELLVALVDCLGGASKPVSPEPKHSLLVVHRNALRRAGILHRDISLFNLLLVLAIHNDLGEDFLGALQVEPEKAELQGKIQKLSRRGLLCDWGYAVPTGDTEDFTQGDVSGIRSSSENEPLSRAKLTNSHNIVIPVADDPLPHNSDSPIDANPLHRTVSFR